jgi:hypothetical protein
VPFQSVGEGGWIIVGMRHPSSSTTGLSLASLPAWAFPLHASSIVARFSLAIAVVGKTKDSS